MGREYYSGLLKGFFDSFRYVLICGLEFPWCKYGFSVWVLDLW